MDGNSNNSTPNVKQDQLLAVLSDVVISSRLFPVMEAKLLIISDNLKDWADQMEMESSTPLPASGVANGGAWMNIAQSSGMASVSFLSLLVVLYDIPLDISFDDIKSALGIFVIFDSLESLNAAVSKTGTLHGCHIWWETLGCHSCYRYQSLDYLAVDYKVLLPLFLKLSSNFASGSNIIKSSFVGAKSYAKATTFVVPLVAAAANMDLAFGAPPKSVVPLLLVVSSGSNVAVNAKLASLETQLSKLFLLIKFIVKPVGFLVVLVTKLLSTLSVIAETIKKSMVGLRNQINAVHVVASALQKKVGPIKLKSGKIYFDISNNKDMDDDNDDDNNDVKNFSVYDNIFGVIIKLWKVQSSIIRSNPNQTVK
ncbi:hypothetical protein G9A89_008184 [Geosiphon pyriformis]|nr:hypothetical protein G9A89_008184 [Geosiphon pyriformis]